MKRKRSTIRQITLPSEPTKLLAGPVFTDQVQDAIQDLFTLFGVDRSNEYADRLLWQAMALCVFPQLGRRRPRPTRGAGRPVAKYSKVTRATAAKAADAWDQFVAENGNQTILPHLYTRFVKQHPNIVFTKGPNAEPVAYSTFMKKVAMGRKSRGQFAVERPPAFSRMSVEARCLYEALDYAGWSFLPIGISSSVLSSGGNLYAGVLQSELLSLKTDSDIGKNRLAEIAAQVESMVPTEISLGMIKVRPFWRRERRDK